MAVTNTPQNQKAKRYQICVPIAPLHNAPSHESGLDTQIVFGGEFDVHDIRDGWAWGHEIVASGKGYTGFVPLSALINTQNPPTHQISILRAPIFTKPDLKSPIRMFLPMNAQVEVHTHENEFHHIRDLGWVHKHHILAHNQITGTDFVEIAELHFGLPYVWGGIGPDGLDCSGLVQTALRAAGRDAPRDTSVQVKEMGHAVDILDDLSGLHRGDLVFWKGHVGIMGDPHMLLHANAHHMGVAIEPLHEAVDRIAQTAGPIISIKRLDIA